jgi:hypothetical protein
VCSAIHTTPAPCRIVGASAAPTAVYAPHVLGELALEMLVELLVGITAPVVEIGLIEAITKVLAECQKLLKIIKDRCDSRVGSERGLAHVAVLLDVNGKVRAVCFVSDLATIFAIFGDLYPYRPAWIAICYLYI